MTTIDRERLRGRAFPLLMGLSLGVAWLYILARWL